MAIASIPERQERGALRCDQKRCLPCGYAGAGLKDGNSRPWKGSRRGTSLPHMLQNLDLGGARLMLHGSAVSSHLLAMACLAATCSVPWSVSRTVFKEHLPKGLSYVLSPTALVELFSAPPCAFYFVRDATWVRQVHPLSSVGALPILRSQLEQPRLRVRSEHISPAAREFTRHIMMYAVPSTWRDLIFQSVVDVLRFAFAEEFVLFCSPNEKAELRALPDWS